MAMANHSNPPKTKRIVRFFQKQIGTCPGVVWEDKQEGMFRIPWVNGKNKEWKEEDSQIFLEWAKFKNKYTDGDQMQYPTWKTQLRCALNRMSDFREVPPRHNLDAPKPYRVYQFVDMTHVQGYRQRYMQQQMSPVSRYGSTPSHEYDITNQQ